MSVWDINNRDCMTAKYDSYRGFSETKNYLTELFSIKITYTLFQTKLQSDKTNKQIQTKKQQTYIKQ